jgi:repressor LexA
MTELTPRQAEILDFIRTFVEAKGYPPTVQEIALWFNIASLNGVACHLAALEKKGCIAREKGKPRTIRVVKTPSACGA